MPDRFAHDAASLLTRQLMASIGHLLREEERNDAFGELYHLARAAIESYAEAEEQRRNRLRAEGDDVMDGGDKTVELTPPCPTSPYLLAAEAAVYLRTTVQGIYSLVKRRKLQPMPGRPGRLLFTRESLDRYVNSRFRR
jgi:hypothetical protein